MVTTTDVRCPAGKLLAKMKHEGETPVVNDGNLLELHCRDCTRYERQTDAGVKRVLHCYDFVGNLVETLVERA